MKKITMFFLLTNCASMSHLHAMQQLPTQQTYTAINPQQAIELAEITPFTCYLCNKENPLQAADGTPTQPSMTREQLANLIFIRQHIDIKQTHNYCLEAWITKQHGTAHYTPKPMIIIPEEAIESIIDDDTIINANSMQPDQANWQGPLPNTKTFLEILKDSLRHKSNSYQTTNQAKK